MYDIAYCIVIETLLLQNLYSAQIQASSSQRRWRIARWGTRLAGVGKEVSFETAFERARFEDLGFQTITICATNRHHKYSKVGNMARRGGKRGEFWNCV